MSITTQHCSVCLKPTQKPLRLSDSDENNIQWSVKLRNIVPELDWNEFYTICYLCQTQLNSAYEFKSICLSLETQRRDLKVEEVKSEPVFVCYHCEESFSDKVVLLEHISRNHLEIPPTTTTDSFSCEQCGKLFGRQSLLDKHAKRCRSCEICGKGYGTTRQLKSHSCVKQNDVKKGRQSHRTFHCEICQQVFNYVKILTQHCVDVHLMDAKSVKAYQCDSCSQRFSSSANLIQHKKYHEGARSHICTFCGKSYITKSDLTSHEYTHYNRRNYKCLVCDKAFNTNKNLRTHQLVVHTDAANWKYSCSYCQKRFPMKTGYNQHLRRHTGDKQFACHICRKLFVSKSEMQKHTRLHSNIREFKCGLCSREYKDRKVYEVHLAKVHGVGDAKVPVRVKKFVCHVCPSQFYDRQKLTRHLCTHSGVKPFGCDRCEKKFTDKSYLKHHLKVAHDVAGPTVLIQ